MSKKIILNDNEIVYNEDVSSAQNWRSRDLNKVLEALCNASFGAGSGTAGAITAGAVLSGLSVSGSGVSLSVSVGAGIGVFAFGGGDLTEDNRYRLASLEAPTTLALPVAHATLYRWDLIEISAEELTTTESRQVLTAIGPTRALVPTVVPKLISSNVRARYRSGTPDALASARLPALQPDSAWMPVAAVLVTPLALTASGLQTLDLRKFFSYTSPARSFVQNDIRDGFQQPVSMSSDGSMVSATHNWVHMGNYRSPIGATAQQSPVNRPQIDPNIDKPASLALQVDTWYYIYAYRPTRNCGYTSMMLSQVAPIANDSDNRGQPSVPGLFELPVPWPVSDTTAPAQYMGAIRLYEDGGTFYPLPFRKANGYTSVAYWSDGGLAGALSDGRIHTGSGGVVSNGVYSTRTINPDGLGYEAVPPHSRLVRLALWFENNAASADTASYYFRTNLTVPFRLFSATGVSPGHSVSTTLDVPVDSAFSVSFMCTGTPGDTGLTRGWVQGFYEEMP